MSSAIADQEQRNQAIDPARSFIVQAPAGSGKTELLIQRYLALLGRVEYPTHILAITFTRKAAAEMRNRLIDALSSAEKECPQEEHKRLTWDLACRALQRDKEMGWNLLSNPGLLTIQTIDSFNSALVRKMPWLSRFGGLPEIAQDAEPLYHKATDRLCRRINRDEPGSKELRCLLEHMDNSVVRMQKMLIAMLQRRDQWLRHLYSVRTEDPCAVLQDALREIVESQLAKLEDSMPLVLREQILDCGRIASSNLAHGKDRPLLTLTDLDWLPGAEAAHLPLWQGIADLLLSARGELRKPGGINATIGFPAADEDPRRRMQGLVTDLASYPDFIDHLADCRTLPDAAYSSSQRDLLQHLVSLLPLLVGELWLVFKSEGKADFAEIGLMARAALGHSDNPSDLLLKLDSRLEHILVDEFQDTSWMQYGLLETLTTGWQPGDGRSLFLVGDPMQSIYRFREAEVGLFLNTFRGRLGKNGPDLEPLRLSCNFRSQGGIVEWVNSTFECIFPKQVDVASGAVPLARAEVVRETSDTPAVSMTAFNRRDDDTEARKVVELIERLKEEQPQATIAILVRSRNHLAQILSQLTAHGYRYQAQDIDPLGEQSVALDLVALARALIHRDDRLAWLSSMRAPWCGLLLADLQILADSADRRTLPQVLQDADSLKSLSVDGQKRVARFWQVMQKGLRQRGSCNLRRTVETCWMALGGPACYEPSEVQDAALVLDLLEKYQKGGDLPTLQGLEESISALYALPDSAADGTIQIMTIHKAKGLEFDHVILPGLGKKSAGLDTPLLRWLEDPNAGLLLAPIAARDGGEQDPIYAFIGKLEQKKHDLETSRLLYVAATRARNGLHLFAHARENSKGELRPASGSLLEKLWPTVASEFSAQAVEVSEQADEDREVLLRRLSPEWQPPAGSRVDVPLLPRSRKASGETEEEPLYFSGWEQPSRRHTGTLVHRILEDISRFAPEDWPEVCEKYSPEMLRSQLLVLGVPSNEVSSSVALAQQALDVVLTSHKAQWILHRYESAASEFEMSGVVDGQVVHAVIDRTFVESGCRWVVDYKTSRPNSGETLNTFLQREAEHYRSQLSTYTKLLQDFDSRNETRAALYFPLIDQFIEVETDHA